MASGKQIELAGAFVTYLVIYFVVVDPLVVALKPFDAAPWEAGAPTRGSHIDEVLTSVRGWLLILGFFPAMFGYFWIRWKLTGRRTAETA